MFMMAHKYLILMESILYVFHFLKQTSKHSLGMIIQISM